MTSAIGPKAEKKLVRKTSVGFTMYPPYIVDKLYKKETKGDGV